MKTEQHRGDSTRNSKGSILHGKYILSLSCILFFAFGILCHDTYGFSAEVPAITVKLIKNEIYVTTSVTLDQKTIDDMNEGMSKEFVFYIDLFRMWDMWPDEFVTGKKIIKTLKPNPIKREYIAENIDGNVYIEKRFRDLNSMIAWAMNFNDLKLTNTRELEPGRYFAKITVDSYIRKLPPVIGYMLFFVPEKEFNISKNSLPFSLNTKGAP